MQIQLKQTEIESALKMYLASQGINMSNKAVTITFTSGRKDNGLSADMDINELAAIPGYTDSLYSVPATPAPAPKPVLAIPEEATIPAALEVPLASMAQKKTLEILQASSQPENRGMLHHLTGPSSDFDEGVAFIQEATPSAKVTPIKLFS